MSEGIKCPDCGKPLKAKESWGGLYACYCLWGGKCPTDAQLLKTIKEADEERVTELTYSEWNIRGFRVHRGQKAVRFENGEAVFAASQVYDATKMSRAEKSYYVRAQAWEEQQF